MTGGSFQDERAEARERLKASLDALAERTNLQVQMQKEPLKMLGGASAVGALIGIVAGRQLRRSKKIYVDAGSPVKDQKGFIKAQQRHKGGGGVGGALVATLGTLAFKALQDRVITPRLEELANTLMERAGQQGQPQAPGSRTATAQARPAPTKPALPRPALSRPTQTPTAQPQNTPSQGTGDRSVPDWAGTPTKGGKANVQPVIPARPPVGGTVQPVSTGGAASFLKNPAPAQAQAGGPPDPASATGSQALNVTASDLPKPAGKVEAKAQGSPIAPQEKANPNIS